MKTSTENAIRAHAIRDYPGECCGLIIMENGQEVYVPCRNVAPSDKKEDHFTLAKADFFAAEERGEVVALVHSHPDMPATPTQGDLVSCEESQLPWYIIRVDGGEDGPVTREFTRTEPTGYQAPLLGREFFHGVLDCYALIRDWFQQERGITLRDFERRHNWWADGSGDDLYMQQFRLAGFVPIAPEDIQVGDCFIMQVRAQVANHAGVYIGNGQFLHHLYGRLSTREVYGGYWRDITRVVVRYIGT